MYSGAVSLFFSFLAIIGNGGKNDSSLSLGTKSLHFSAPIGITYGILALIIAFGMDKTNEYLDLTKKTNQLEAQLDKAKHNKDGSFQESFSAGEAKSIFGGQVLVEYNSFKEVKFSGIKGIRENNSTGQWHENAIEVDKGVRFYLMCYNGKWGVNTLRISQDGRTVYLEFYPVK